MTRGYYDAGDNVKLGPTYGDHCYNDIKEHSEVQEANGCKWSTGSYHEAVKWGPDYLIKVYTITLIVLYREIHGRMSTLQTMKGLFIPSAFSLAVSQALVSLTSEVDGEGQDSPNVQASEQMAPRGQFVFAVGVGALVFVPVFKAVTSLPHFYGYFA